MTLKELAEGEQSSKTTSQAYEDGEEISNVIMFLSSQLLCFLFPILRQACVL